VEENARRLRYLFQGGAPDTTVTAIVLEVPSKLIGKGTAQRVTTYAGSVMKEIASE
jgi:hypothetical protein